MVTFDFTEVFKKTNLHNLKDLILKILFKKKFFFF